MPSSENPLLDRWTEVHRPRLVVAPAFARAGLDGAMPGSPDDFLASFHAREESTRRWAWAVPTDRALRAIAEHSPLIEIGAGTGYWTALLVQMGADVVAFDREPPGPGVNNLWHRDARPWWPVSVGGPEKVAEYPGRTLFLCWPPYDDPMATECLRRYKGDVVVYIGEWYGATADDEFHEMLERDFDVDDALAIPQWRGIHDALYVCQRKAP